MDKSLEGNHINEMIQVLRNVAKGDCSEQIKLSGINDDLDSLAMEINMMIDDIRSRSQTEKIRLQEMEQANEELCIIEDASEIVVKDLDNKRRELNALNNELHKEIVEHKKTAETLKENEETFRTMSAAAQDAIIMIDNESKVIFWNNAAEKIFGFSSQEIIGKELHSHIVPKIYHESCMEGFAKFRESGDGNVVGKTIELKGLKKDGTEFPVELSMSSVYLKGKWNAIGILRDITDRNRAEIALQNKTNALGERIKEMNCILSASKIMADSGISIERALMDIVELIPPSWQFPEVTCARITFMDKEFKTPNFIETKWTQYADIFVGKEKKGTVQINYLEEKPDFDEGPFLLEERDLIDVLAREIGKFLDRRHAEDEKTSYMKQLKEKNKELDDFTYIVSHDLKAPLITIQGFAGLLKRKYNDQLDERAVHYLDNMVTAANDLNVLITDLLEFSRAGRKAFKKERISLIEAVKRSMFSLQVILNESGAQISVPDDLPNVLYDPIRLRQVLNNLLSNAIKYSSPQRAPKIDIGWSNENKAIKLWIKDNGIGISSDNMNKVFAPFTRISRDKKGTGIGLSIVKTIVERHGGRIWVDSEIDKGSTFYLTIPKEL